MEKPLTIKWKRPARKNARVTYAWYKKEMGIRAADKFINSILDTVNLLALNPNMGQPIELNTETCKRNYRSFVEHKNHKIIYYVEKKTICIANIWSNSQNPEDFNEQTKNKGSSFASFFILYSLTTPLLSSPPSPCTPVPTDKLSADSL